MTQINMKKNLILLVLVFASLTTMGQFRVGLGLIGGLPTGNFGDVNDFGGGAYLEAKASFGNIEAGVNVSGLVFAGTDIDGSNVSVDATTVVPITAIGHYFFDVTGVKPYAGIGLGPYIASFGDISSTGGGSFDAGSETKFGFAPQAGINLGSFDIRFAYHIVSDLNYLSLNLGFNIGRRGD